MADVSPMDDPAIEIRPAWGLEDPGLERDAIAFWRRLGVLPPDVTLEARAKELCSLIYIAGEVVAVSTAAIKVLPYLKAPVAMMRVAVDPAHRRRHLAVKALQADIDLLEQWSLQNPGKALGAGVVVQADNIDPMLRMPNWVRTGLNLVRFTPTGYQVRIAWFDHAELD